MIVKESGVAVGWPLNLGHDTTGWPLGLRLRLIHEDLQWPKLPDLARSSSLISTDSSSLDTTSTASFFQDKSISLGALIGLPMLDSVGNRQYQQHGPLLSRFAAPSSPPTSPVQTANNTVVIRPNSRLHHHGPVSAEQQQQPSTGQASSPSAASSAGWSLLSVLSCARVPAEIGAPVKEAAETSIPRAQLVAREGQFSSRLAKGSELERVEEGHESTNPPTTTQLSRGSAQLQSLNSLPRKLYDNIAFVDEELEMSNSGLSSDGNSSEWNPLFSSSSHLTRDEDENEDSDDVKHDQRSGATAIHCDHSLQEQRPPCTKVPLVALTRSSNSDTDALLYYSKGSSVRIGCLASASFFIDMGKWQQKQQQQLGHEKSQQKILDILTEDDDSEFTSRPAREFSRNKAVSAFISRMVCCRSTPTRGSSFNNTQFEVQNYR